MYEGGPIWVPPAMASAESDASKGVTVVMDISENVKLELEEILKNLTVERELIRDAMGFVIENATFAMGISDIISEWVLRDSSVPKKLARLFLISDVLYNCSGAQVAHASSYRVW